MPTYQQIATKAQERAALSVSSRLRLQSFIDEALDRLADKVAADSSRRQLLMTPRTTTVDLTDGVADLSAMITGAPFINAKKIRAGIVFLDDNLCQWAGESANRNFPDAIDDLFTTIYWENNSIRTKDDSLSGTLNLQVPFVPTLAALPDALVDDLIDKVLELAMVAEAEDGKK